MSEHVAISPNEAADRLAIRELALLINEVAANFESWDAYKKKIEFHVN